MDNTRKSRKHNIQAKILFETYDLKFIYVVEL